jgi:hypothetical protein
MPIKYKAKSGVRTVPGGQARTGCRGLSLMSITNALGSVERVLSFVGSRRGDPYTSGPYSCVGPACAERWFASDAHPQLHPGERHTHANNRRNCNDEQPEHH